MECIQATITAKTISCMYSKATSQLSAISAFRYDLCTLVDSSRAHSICISAFNLTNATT